jgi:tellurite resistance protein TehA-like permease
MRREFLWYGIALCWAIASFVGLLLRHRTEALPALFFALVFAAVGVWIGKHDEALRRRRSSRR